MAWCNSRRCFSTTEQSFFVKKEETVENSYDLSINKYKEVEYIAKEYPPTNEIIRDIEEQHLKIGKEINNIKKLLKIEEL